MKHLVVVAGVYYPHPSPTGKCVSQYISLLKDAYHVDVVFVQSDLRKTYGAVSGGETLYGLVNWRLWAEAWFQSLSRKTTNRLFRYLSTAGVKIMKAIGCLQSIVLFPNNLRWFYMAAYRTLCDIHKVNPIDVVLTVNSPFSAHLAGEAFKEAFPEAKWVTYTVDPFSRGMRLGRVSLPGRRSRSRALAVEQRVLSRADFNFLSPEVYRNCREIYAESADRVSSLPYLIFPTTEPCRHRFDSDKINLVYAGRFYRDIRSPEFLLRTFLLTKNADLVLHLYAVSDCESLIDEYVRRASGRIIRHELVDSEEIKKILSGADILVSVGNSVPEFRPSKTFEYIATGRPIINIYQGNLKDETLKRYSYALQVSTNMDYQSAASEIERFCVSNKGNRMMPSAIEAVFSDHSAQRVRSVLLAGME